MLAQLTTDKLTHIVEKYTGNACFVHSFPKKFQFPSEYQFPDIAFCPTSLFHRRDTQNFTKCVENHDNRLLSTRLTFNKNKYESTLISTSAFMEGAFLALILSVLLILEAKYTTYFQHLLEYQLEYRNC